MGSYLSRPPPRLPSPALLGGEHPDSPESLGPSHSARRGPHAGRVSSTAPTPSLARRVSHEDLLFWPRRRRHHRRRRFLLLHRRPYLLQQARGFFLGSWTSGMKGSLAKKPKHSAYSSRMLCTALILQTVAVRGKQTLRSALQQTVLCVWASLSGQLPPSLAKTTTAAKTVERDAKVTPKEKDLTASAEGGHGQTKLQETPSRLDAPNPEAPKQQPTGASDGSDVGKSSESAFRRLMFHGALASFVPRPGPLQLPYKRFLGNQLETSRRNAISSSYSSTRGFLPPPLRVLAGPAGRTDGPAKKEGGDIGEEAPWTPTYPSLSSLEAAESVSEEPPNPSPQVQGAETEPPLPSGQKHQEPDSAPEAPKDPSRPRKRTVCLLRPCKPNEPLILPPAPQPGYPVTSEDLDAEKRAAIEWINKVLEG